MERNITIKLGYANAKIYKCNNSECPRPGCYKSYGSGKEDNPPCERPGCGGTMQLVRHISFVGKSQLISIRLATNINNRLSRSRYSCNLTSLLINNHD